MPKQRVAIHRCKNRRVPEFIYGQGAFTQSVRRLVSQGLEDNKPASNGPTFALATGDGGRAREPEYSGVLGLEGGSGGTAPALTALAHRQSGKSDGWRTTPSSPQGRRAGRDDHIVEKTLVGIKGEKTGPDAERVIADDLVPLVRPVTATEARGHGHHR